MEYYSAVKRKEIPIHATVWTNLEKNPNSYEQRIGAGAGEWEKWVRVVNGTNFKL